MPEFLSTLYLTVYVKITSGWIKSWECYVTYTWISHVGLDMDDVE